MVRSKEELLESLRAKIGEDTSDETIALLEDISDTVDELTGRASEDWKQKYEENDASWRKRYQERFFSGKEPDDNTTVLDQTEETEESGDSSDGLTLEDLLK